MSGQTFNETLNQDGDGRRMTAYGIGGELVNKATFVDHNGNPIGTEENPMKVAQYGNIDYLIEKQITITAESRHTTTSYGHIDLKRYRKLRVVIFREILENASTPNLEEEFEIDYITWFCDNEDDNQRNTGVATDNALYESGSSLIYEFPLPATNIDRFRFENKRDEDFKITFSLIGII